MIIGVNEIDNGHFALEIDIALIFIFFLYDMVRYYKFIIT